MTLDSEDTLQDVYLLVHRAPLWSYHAEPSEDRLEPLSSHGRLPPQLARAATLLYP